MTLFLAGFSGVVFGWGRDSTEHHCLYGAGEVGLHPGVFPHPPGFGGVQSLLVTGVRSVTGLWFWVRFFGLQSPKVSH